MKITSILLFILTSTICFASSPITKEEFNEFVEIADSVLGKSMQRMSMNGIENAVYMSARPIDTLVKKLEPKILEQGLKDMADSKMMEGFDKGLEQFKQMGMKLNDQKIYSNDEGDSFTIMSMSMSQNTGGVEMNMDMIIVQYMNVEKATAGFKDKLPVGE